MAGTFHSLRRANAARLRRKVSDSIFEKKRALRRTLAAIRRSVSQDQARSAALALRRRILSAGFLLRAQRLSFYLPQNGECDLLPLINTALERGKDCYLPLVPARTGRPMRFARLGASRHWHHNRFGIPENHDPHPRSARHLDVMFMPLLGFDASGNRLGMGGGFYDATLAYLRARRVWRKPLLIGVAYEAQKVAEIPAEAWDVPLDYIVTERTIYGFSPRQA